MAVHRILQLGDPMLRKVSTPVETSLGERKLLDDLRDTLHAFQRSRGFGRGISAIQIGTAKRVIYIEFEGAAYCLINPEYEWLSEEKFRLWDDCFSFPDLMVWLERSQTLRLRYTDENGDQQIVDASGALSELIQHEMDHLDGILAVDRAIGPNGLATREEWIRNLSAEPATAGQAARAR
jgi:peptide deformylase